MRSLKSHETSILFVVYQLLFRSNIWPSGATSQFEMPNIPFQREYVVDYIHAYSYFSFLLYCTRDGAHSNIFQQVNLMCTSIVTYTPVLRSYVVLCDLRMGMKCNGHEVCTTAISDACSVPNCCAQHFVIVIGLFLPESSVRAKASCSHLCP